MRLLPLLAAIFFLILPVSFSAKAETIKVASIFSKTGKAAFDNAKVLTGTRLAIKELNQQGGILGKKLQLIEFDNKSTPLGSKIAAEKAVKENVSVVFGSLWSSHSLAVAKVLQSAKIPMISPGSTNPKVTLVGDYIFRACYIDSFQGEVMANFALKDLKAYTAVVLTNVNSKYSEGLTEYFVRNYKAKGGKILLKENYLEQTSNFTFIINKIKMLQPQVVFLPGHAKDAAYIIKQAKHSGVLAIFIGGDGWNPGKMYEIAGDIVNGCYYSEHWHKDKSGEKTRQFIKKYKNHGNRLNAATALSIDSVFLFADAVRRAGSFKPIKIREALAATKDFKGVTGNISFNKNGDPIKSAVILKLEKGTSTYVKTIEP